MPMGESSRATTALPMKVAPSRAPAALIVGILLLAGCAGVERSPKVDAAPVVPASAAAPTEAPPAPAAPPAAAVAPPGPVSLATTERGVAAPGPAVSPAAQVDAASKRPPVSPLPASTPKAAPKPAPAPQTAAQSPKTPAAPVPVPVPAKAEAPPSLDLKSLETRLRETKAIGVFTKLALKNQIDELLDQFRSYYQGRTKTSLAELRQSFDRLVLKTLALLQDTDPPLAGAIASSRESIWGILSDPKKFAAV
jgi:hypothetical protein